MDQLFIRDFFIRYDGQMAIKLLTYKLVDPKFVVYDYSLENRAIVHSLGIS